MEEIIITLVGLSIIYLLLYLSKVRYKKEALRFYEEINVGDTYHYITDSNVFIQPVEIVRIVDKKDNYIKYTIEKTRSGEICERSCSIFDFYDLVCEFNLIKQEKI